MTFRNVASLLLLTSAVISKASFAEAQTKSVTAAFSDPTRPGMLKVVHRQGRLTVLGKNRADVLVEIRQSGKSAQTSSFANDDRAGGLRQLTEPQDIAVQEANNEVVVSTSPSAAAWDVRIEVPTRTNLSLSIWSGGPMTVEAVDGDIEAHNQGNSISLQNVSGSVVAYAHEGTVKVTMTRVSTGKPMAFSAFDGDVDVSLPPSTKAMLKMQTDKEIFTDFDLRSAAQSAVDSHRTGGPRARERIVEGSLNDGGPLYTLRTFNGNIYLRKYAAR